MLGCAPMTGDSVECFNCGRANPSWAQVCRSCGVPMRPGGAGSKPPASRLPTDRDSLFSIGAALATINRLPVLLLPGDVFATRVASPVLQELELPGSGDVAIEPPAALGSLPEAAELLLDRRDGRRRGRAVGDVEGQARGVGGVAALLELARMLHAQPVTREVRFVAFVNEEPPFFKTPQMGSVVYANGARARGDRVVAMLSLETMGYYSDEKGSQEYPAPLSGLYHDVGNFIGFVANLGLQKSLANRCY